MVEFLAFSIFTMHCFLFIEGIYLFEEGKILSKPFAIFEGSFGPKQCLKECLLRKRCKAIGYKRQKLQCQLGSSEDTLDHSDKGYTVAGSPSLIHYQSLAGICTNHNCTVGQKCQKRDKETKCIVSDCEEPPALLGCTPSNVLSTVGVEVLYSPKPKYEIVGTNGITCKASGKWTSPKLTCRKKCTIGYMKEKEGNNYLCYSTFYSTSTYNESIAHCEDDGGHLIRLNTEWKINEVKKYLGGNMKYFVDGKITLDDVWVYSDGKEFMRNATQTYNALRLGYNVAIRNGEFVVAFPDHKLNFICEI